MTHYLFIFFLLFTSVIYSKTVYPSSCGDEFSRKKSSNPQNNIEQHRDVKGYTEVPKQIPQGYVTEQNKDLDLTEPRLNWRNRSITVEKLKIFIARMINTPDRAELYAEEIFSAKPINTNDPFMIVLFHNIIMPILNVHTLKELTDKIQGTTEDRFKEIFQHLFSLNQNELFISDHRLLSDKPLTIEAIAKKLSIPKEEVQKMETHLQEKITTTAINYIYYVHMSQ